ncbi:MAG: SpoIIIAH-like family protein [bacterium]|nr:SpoIIIAH-like family protein [bacterium]
MKNLKNIFKKNQVIIAALAIMIIVAGYLNFTRGKLGDNAGNGGVEANAEIPENELELENAQATNDGDKSASETTSGKSEAGEAVLANNKISSDYFVSNKLKREQTRAKNEETLRQIAENDKLKDAQKQDAINQLVELTDIKEKESVTESLLEAKGFPESLVTINDGKVEVIVNANNLTEQQIAQIEDVVKRKTGISAKNIVISPVTVSESADAATEEGTIKETTNTDAKNAASTEKNADTKKESTESKDTSKDTTNKDTKDSTSKDSSEKTSTDTNSTKTE